MGGLFGGGSAKAARMAQMQAAQEAAEARAREEARQARLREGSEKVNKTFDSISPDFYSGISNNIETLGMSDLSEQFRKARENLMFSLARSGMLSSSVANEGAADLQQKQNEGAQKVQLQGRDAVNKVRSGVENERSSTISQLYATENPDLAANTALTKQALILQDKPDYNPLGDVFAGVLNGFNSALSTARQYNSGGSTFGATASPDTSLRTGAGGRVVGGA